MKLYSIILLIFMVIIVPAAYAQITVDSFTAMPQKVQPGQDVTISFTLHNVGRDDIENIIVSLDLSPVPFAPLGSSTQRTIDEIRDRRQETVSFTLRALPEAEMKVYKIPLLITHDSVTTTSLIGVEVTAEPHLDVLVDSSDVLKVGEAGKVTFKFVNDGLTQIDFLKATLQPLPGYDIISAPSLYIGEVDLGDFETEEFTIIPRLTNPIVGLHLEYRDLNNRVFTESKLIRLQVYTPEEAEKMGLVESSSWLPLLMGLLILGIILIMYFKRRKRKHAL